MWRTRVGSCVVVPLAVLIVASCSVDDAPGVTPDAAAVTFVAASDDLDGTLPLADEALDDPEVTTVATDLAPSQVSASTVADPDTPAPCAADDLELWTAQVRPHDGVADAVIRVRNAGDAWCEADVGRSPRLDPAIEPDVWLLPGATADLVVGQVAGACAEPTAIRQVQVGIGEESVLVPTAIVSCGWWLSAFYPNDDAVGSCTADELETAAVEDAVLVRNASATYCSLGSVTTAVDGGSGDDAGTTRVEVLAPGDVVAVGRSIVGCDEPPGRVVLRGLAVDEVVVDDVSCDVSIPAGWPRPWFGMPDGPLASLPADAGLADVFGALDPFTPGA